MTPCCCRKPGRWLVEVLFPGFSEWFEARICVPEIAAMVLLLLVLFLPTRVRADATVLIYHRFGETEYPTTDVPVDNFKAQMRYLKDNGYQVVPLARIVEAVHNKETLADKTVAITIDDGYSSTYTTAWPILKEYGYPFTVFFYVGAVDRHFRNFLTFPQIREMAAAGVDFEDHSYSHPRFGSRPAGLDDQQYKDWVKLDLTKSRERFRKALGHLPKILALPYGEYNKFVLDVCREMGYEAVFSQDPGAISADSDILTLPREPIVGNEWSTMKHFVMVLRRKDLPIDSLMPSLTPLAGRVPKRFGARLLYPQRYIPNSFGIYVSELGWHKGEEKDGVVSMPNDQPLSRRMNRVMISAKEKGTNRTAVRFWMVFSE